MPYLVTFEHLVIISLLSCGLLVVLAGHSALLKAKRGIKPYDLIEDETVRIADRIHYNTIENFVVFMPLLWITALYGSLEAALIIGWIWLIARVGYARAYTKNPKSRSRFFQLSFFAIVLFMLVILYHLLF